MSTRPFSTFMSVLLIGLFSTLHASQYALTGEEGETDPDKLARFLLGNIDIDGGPCTDPQRFENSLSKWDEVRALGAFYSFT